MSYYWLSVNLGNKGLGGCYIICYVLVTVLCRIPYIRSLCFAQWLQHSPPANADVMRPGFDSRTLRHMWVEFVVGSGPCSDGFSPGSLVFLPPQKSTRPNSNLIVNCEGLGFVSCNLFKPSA